MRAELRSCALLLSACAAVAAPESDVQELFAKTRQRVLENGRRLPRYTCVETISRAQYVPAKSAHSSCDELIALRRQAKLQTMLVARDRFRVDVAVIDGGEMFSWAGAGKFETPDVDKLLGGGTSGSGDFGSFVTSVFGNAPDRIQYLGLRNSLAVFGYNVPLARSTYRFHASGPEKTIGFHGTFSIDPSDGDLQQLLVEADQFTAADGACLVQHVMNYQNVKIGNGNSLLPEVSTMRALYRNGGESVNETRYSDCREYVGESTIRFDDVDSITPQLTARAALPPMPPNVRLQIGLSMPIDAEIAAAGDEVTGILLQDARDKVPAPIAHQKDRVHGRIVRLKRTLYPVPRWSVAIRFDTIERNGFEQPISLRPLENKFPSPFPELPPETGIFIFDGHGSQIFDQKFHSSWETR